jgi:hypothetical protein
VTFLNAIADASFIDRRRPLVRISGRVIGWVVVVLSVLLLIALFAAGLPSVLVAGSGGHGGNFAVAIAGWALLIVAQLGMLVGAWQMTRGLERGRRTLLQALAVSVVFSLIYNLGVANLGQFVLQLVVRTILYYLVAVSSKRSEI